jgi:hypothetical protein
VNPLNTVSVSPRPTGAAPVASLAAAPAGCAGAAKPESRSSIAAATSGSVALSSQTQRHQIHS